MKQRSLLFIFLLSILSGFAQPASIMCSSERNADNTVSIYADCQIYAEYTVKLMFIELRGYSSSISTSSSGSTEIALVTVYRGRREILRLTPIKSASSFALTYKYSYWPGTALRKMPDSNFVYLFPGSEGKQVHISRVGSVSERIGQNNTDNIRALGFGYKLGDTLCATRGGVVFDCSDAIKEGEKGMEVFKSERNHITMQHKDGTLASYSILSPIQLLVSAGDNVIPGQPIAILNKESERYTVLFSVYYLDEKKVLIDNSNSNSKKSPTAFTYLPTIFYGEAGAKPNIPEINKYYTISHPKEIVTLEMSKKDKKKLGL